MSPFSCHLVIVVLHGLVHMVVSADDETGVEKRAWACYGNFHNFLDISCPPDRNVKLISMMNGAKPTNQGCPDMTTDMDNFRKECCTFQQGDCVIETHHNNFPVECSNLHFCRPQSRLADTWPQCNSNDFPKFTHYTEITYKCITPPVETVTTTTTTVTMGRKQTINSVAAVTPSSDTTTTTLATNATTVPSTAHRTQRIAVKDIVDDTDNFTPAMIGGMIAGIVGLLLTIFIFMFYWGRKRQIRIAGKPQSSVWDFLLANTMSVRAFRGYDNFSSSRQSVSSEDGSPVIRKTVWLPNISLDSGQGESAVTSDDNISVVTVEHAAAGAAAGGGGFSGARRGSLGAGARAGPRAGPGEGPSGRGESRGSFRNADVNVNRL